MIVGRKLLDLGDIEKIDWVDPEGVGNWKIRVVGSRGAWAYNPVVVISRDCFEDGGVQLWDVRLECLRREWITKSGKGRWELHPGDKIKVPHMADALEWACRHAKESWLWAIDVVRGRRVWVNCDGCAVNEPDWFLPQFKMYSLYGILNLSRGRGMTQFDPDGRAFNRHALVKYFLDVCSGRNNDMGSGVNAVEYSTMRETCERVIDVAKAINKMVKRGYDEAVARGLDERCDQIDELLGRSSSTDREMCDLVGQFDFASSIMKSVEEIRASRAARYACCVTVPRKFNPFRYPGTSITEHTL